MTTSDAVQELRSIPFEDAEGNETTLGAYGDGVVLVVNVASRCGLAPQYETLEKLQREYGPRGLQVIGFPCNQFFGQPGSVEQILDYCATTWGISFPIAAKIKVNGAGAAPLYKALKKAPDEEGTRGPILWNFEKFVLTPSGQLHRFRPTVTPDDARILSVIEDNLPS